MKYTEAYRLRKTAEEKYLPPVPDAPGVEDYILPVGAGAVLGGAGMAAVGALLSEKGKRWRGVLKGLAYGAPLGALAGLAGANTSQITDHGFALRRNWLDDRYTEARLDGLEEDSLRRSEPVKLMQAIWDANKKVKLNGDKVEYK